MDDKLMNALLIVLCVNLLLWLGQAASLAMNPEGPVFITCEGDQLNALRAGGCNETDFILDDSDPAGGLPTQGGGVNVDTGNFFVDTYNAMINWMMDSSGLRYIYNIVAAPANFMKAIGVPSAVTGPLAAAWYGSCLLLLVAFILGR